MSKKLCNIKVSFYLKVINKKYNDFISWTELRYCDLDTEEISLNTWDEVIREFNPISEDIEEIKGKHVLKVLIPYSNGLKSVRLCKETLINVTFKREVEEVSLYGYTLRDLINQLPVEECIDFLKDRGMGIVI